MEESLDVISSNVASEMDIRLYLSVTKAVAYTGSTRTSPVSALNVAFWLGLSVTMEAPSGEISLTLPRSSTTCDTSGEEETEKAVPSTLIPMLSVYTTKGFSSLRVTSK